MYYLAESINGNLDALTAQLGALVARHNEAAAADAEGTAGGALVGGGEGAASDGAGGGQLAAVTQILAQHYRSLEWLESATRTLTTQVAGLDRLAGAGGASVRFGGRPR
jgi:hypothetical protein